MDVPSIIDMMYDVAETAEECPGCGWEPDPEAGHVSRSESYGEVYYGVKCRDCGRWQYEHHGKEWIKLTPPGEPNPTVDKA